VTAVYDYKGENKTLIITNDSGNDIIIFSKKTKKIFTNTQIFKDNYEKPFEKKNLDVIGYCENIDDIIIRSKNSLIIEDVKCDANILPFYKITEKSQFVSLSQKNDITIGERVKEEKKVETKDYNHYKISIDSLTIVIEKSREVTTLQNSIGKIETFISQLENDYKNENVDEQKKQLLEYKKSLEGLKDRSNEKIKSLKEEQANDNTKINTTDIQNTGKGKKTNTDNKPQESKPKSLNLSEYDKKISKCEKNFGGLSGKDSLLLKSLLKECEILLNEIDNEVKNQKLNDKQKQEIDKFKDRLNNLIFGIIKMSVTLNKQEMSDIETRYRNEVLFNIDTVKDKKLFEKIKNKTEESSFTKWIGKNIIILDLDTLKNNFSIIEKRSTDFIKIEVDNYTAEADRYFVQNLKREIPKFYDDLDYYESKLEEIEIPWLMLIITGVVLLLVIIGIVFYIKQIIRRKNNKRIEDENTGIVDFDDDDDENDMLSEIDKMPEYMVGLDYLKNKTGSEYYEIDMRTIFDDTAIRYVYFSRQAIIKIHQFFSDFLASEKKIPETGCFLVGNWEYNDITKKTYNISIEFVIEPGDDAEFGEYRVSFGDEIQLKLYAEIENLRKKTGREYLCTAWMHSHPELGLFLSNFDIGAQSQLVYYEHPNRMLAIVIDPRTSDFRTAFFSPKLDGSMNNNDMGDKYNKNNPKKFISFDELQAWATKPADIKEEIPNYYPVNLPAKGINYLFSPSSIISISKAIVNHKAGLNGYFYGDIPYGSQTYRKNIIIEEFSDTENPGNYGNPSPIGCLLIAYDVIDNKILNEYIPDAGKIDFCALYQPDSDKMDIVPKNADNIFDFTEENRHSTYFKDMVTWLRTRKYE
jgi:hypothetical protein